MSCYVAEGSMCLTPHHSVGMLRHLGGKEGLDRGALREASTQEAVYGRSPNIKLA